MSELSQLHTKAQKALNSGNIPLAQQTLIQILQKDQSHFDAIFLLGIIEAELGQYTKACALIQKALQLHQSAEYYAHLAKCFAMMGKGNETHSAIESALKFDITSALTFDTLGVALSRLGEHDKAITYFEQAINRKPQASFYYNLGSSQTFAGQFDAARQSYESAIELQPLFYQAHSSLSHLGGVSKDNNHIERLKQVYEQMPHADGKLHISHALSRELDAIGEYEQSFAYLHNAKSDKLKKLNYQFNQDKQLFTGIKALFEKEFEDKEGTQNNHSTAAPIFVVGMPRSGTTLIERVLTNNTGVKSAGELQEFGLALKQLSNTPGRYILDAATIEAAETIDYAALGHLYMNSLRRVINPSERFVDKMPLNVLYAGLIAKALPKAKIVCVIRNPMDTVWGNYKQMFSLNDPYYNYAYDQVSIAEYYSEFVALADFWQQAFPSQFKIVSYDEFVNVPEKVGKDMVEFCELPFSPELLDITKNKSAVATASSVQVRSAISTKSLGQWRRYEEQLQDAKQVFLRNNIPVV
jgi:tetratricopeptide (TPR) repeat protein